MTAQARAVVRRIVLLTCGAVCLAAGLHAQRRPSPQATFRAGVELVQIDVVVLDADGRPVRGLAASDFTIADRDKPQDVAAFEEVTHAREPSASALAALPLTLKRDVASNQTADADRLVVLVIDDLHIWTGRTERTKVITRQVLEKLGRDATMAVLFTSGDRSVEPTADRGVLWDAVESTKGRQSIRRPNDAFDQPGMLQPFFDNMALYKTLQDAARLLGTGDARRKAFILVSEGISQDLTGVFDAPVGPCEGRSRGPCYHEVAAKQMMDAMHRANVVSYNIDPRGYVSSQDTARESFGATGEGDDAIFRWESQIRRAQDSLAVMADASGGFAVVNTDDFTGNLDRIIADLDHYYLLGFYPEGKGKGYRPLDVRVPAHPEWTVRFRKGYRIAEALKPPKNANPLVALSAGILPKPDLSLALTAVPLAAGAGKEARVAIVIEVSSPRAALQDADGHLRDELTYEVLVVDQKKKKVKTGGGLRARVTLSPSVSDEDLPDVARYQVTDTIAVPPGRYQLRVSAQSSKLAAGGSVYLAVEVPDFRDADSPALGGIAIGYAAGPRVPAATTTRPPATPVRRGSRAPSPDSTPLALPFAPTLDRAFAATDTLRIYFEMAGASAGVLEVLKAGGEQPVVTTRPFTADARGAVAITLPLDTLLEGAYILRMTARSGAASATREVGFVIR
jgi:VWFA-related protein